MSDSSNEPWSNNPNAPRITSHVYLGEKENFAGIFIGTIFYGIAVVLFFQCMGTLLDPANRTRGGVKWGLVAHTTAMFSFVSIYTAVSLDLQPISYINNREFPAGPLLYQFFVSTKGVNIIPNIMYPLNQWLADGLLLYRCYVIYAMNKWIIAFPCLMYVATVALGIVFIYQTVQPAFFSSHNTAAVNIGLSYYSISFSLNVLLTLMIVIRLILHSRNIRKAMGASAQASGLYKVVVTMLIESSALYAVTSLLFIIPWSIKSGVQFIFFPILADAQVIGPFLITLRVANHRALTSETIVSEHIGSIRFRSHKSVGGTVDLPGGSPTISVDDGDGLTASETTIDSRRDEA